MEKTNNNWTEVTKSIFDKLKPGDAVKMRCSWCSKEHSGIVTGNTVCTLVCSANKNMGFRLNKETSIICNLASRDIEIQHSEDQYFVVIVSNNWFALVDNQQKYNEELDKLIKSSNKILEKQK